DRRDREGPAREHQRERCGIAATLRGAASGRSHRVFRLELRSSGRSGFKRKSADNVGSVLARVNGPMVLARLLAVLALCALVPGPARAHALRLATGDVTVQGKRVDAALQFARAELDVLRPEEVAGTIEVASDGAPCRLLDSSTAPAQEDGVLVTARWECP